jgi:hypothetical protein
MLPSSAALFGKTPLRSMHATTLWSWNWLLLSLVDEIPLAEILSPLYGDSNSPKSDFDSAVSSLKMAERQYCGLDVSFKLVCHFESPN